MSGTRPIRALQAKEIAERIHESCDPSEQTTPQLKTGSRQSPPMSRPLVFPSSLSSMVIVACFSPSAWTARLSGAVMDPVGVGREPRRPV
jgi:hypothetical protein